MPRYAITVSPDEAGGEFKAVLRGPGIESEGRRFVFANTHRCAIFAQAVNFAYEQGFRDGLRKSIGNEVRLSSRQGAGPRRTTSKAVLDLYARALRARVNAIESELEIGFSFVGLGRCATVAKTKRKALGKARTACDAAIASFHLIRNDLAESAMNSIVDRLRELEQAMSDCYEAKPRITYRS
jgi:hypothetical protein